MRAITLGVHVVDVLVRPVEEIPEGQGGQLVEEIRITPAGPAGGTALTLAKLGAEVRSAGAIGTDALGDVLVDLLGRFGVDTVAAGAPRRASRPRPACCRSGPTARARPFTWSAPTPPTPPPTRPGTRSPRPPTCTSARPSSWAARRRPRSSSFAREHGVVTSADILAPGDQAAAILRLDRAGVRAPRLPAAQRRAGARASPAPTTSLDRLPRAARAGRRLRGRHPRRRRRRGRRRATASEAVPAFAVDVVDTTGCGDAFSAGFLRGLALGRDRAARRRARLRLRRAGGGRTRLRPRRLRPRRRRRVRRRRHTDPDQEYRPA